jgi:hypothetical protein
MKRTARTILLGAAVTLGALIANPTILRAGDSTACKDCPAMADAKTAPASLDRIKALAGTWVGKGSEKMSGQTLTITFRPTAAGSAVVETMFPGSAHEMVNVYHGDGSTLMLTHYCAMGVQPRMRLASAEGNKLRFEFVDGANIKSRNDPHMDSVELTIDGDKLTENWSYFKDGKVIEHAVFELTRQPEKAQS